MKHKDTKLPKVLGVGTVLGSFYAYYLWNMKLLENFEYKIVGFKILNSNINKIRFQINLNIINESSIAVTVNNYDFDVYLNNVKVGNVSNASTNQVLKGGGQVSSFSILGDIQTFSLIGTGLLSALSCKNSTLRLKGFYGIRKGFIKLKDLPMDETFDLAEEEI